jgi:hypothetical protein
MIDPIDRCFFKHVEGLFPQSEIIRIREYLEKVWNTIDPGALSFREQKIHRLGAAPDDIRFDHAWYNLWKSVSPDKLDELRPFTRLIFPLQIRHITQVEQRVPWHQDIGYQVLREKKGQDHLITCFVPVEPEPYTVPTVEFAVGEFPTLAHEPYGDHGATLEFADLPDTVHFELNCGDALVFGDHAPHQTHVPARPARSDRWSFEFRLVRPQDCLADSDYFDIEEGIFVKT